MREAEGGGVEGGGKPIPPVVLQRALRALAALVDRLIAAISEQYQREAESRARTPERRRAELVRRLLAGESAEVSELAYELEGWHLGLVAAGSGAEAGLRELGRSLGRRALLLRQEGGRVWAWLGSLRPGRSEEALRAVGAALAPGSVAAIGEPARGLSGFSLTHRQALAAFTVAEHGPEPLVRYAEVPLLAAALRDDLLSASLRRLYLEPLERERDGGAVLLETLHAYFDAGRNVSSAAAELGINRKTAGARLRTIEARLGRPLGVCAAELQTALHLRRVRPQAPPGVAM